MLGAEWPPYLKMKSELFFAALWLQWNGRIINRINEGKAAYFPDARGNGRTALEYRTENLKTIKARLGEAKSQQEQQRRSAWRGIVWECS